LAVVHIMKWHFILCAVCQILCTKVVGMTSVSIPSLFVGAMSSLPVLHYLGGEAIGFCLLFFILGVGFTMILRS